MKYLLIILLTCCLTQQAAGQNGAAVLAAAKKLPGFQLPSHTRALVIIADNTCIKCNQHLSSVMARFLSRPNFSFIIAANPGNLDLSPYYAHRQSNIYIDRELRMTSDNTVQTSTVILFTDNGKIDSIIAVNYKDAASQIAYLEKTMSR